MFSQSMKRRLDGTCKKEDDLTKMIEEFFSKQEQVESYTIVEGHPNWLVDVDGSLHIRKEELLSDGTLGFKLNNVSGNLICHIPRISSALLPKHLSGDIVFDVESNANLPVDASSTISDGAPRHSDAPFADVPEDETYFDFLDIAPDKDAIHKSIRSLLVDAEDEMAIDELQKILNEAREQRLIDYELDLKIKNKGNTKDPKITVDLIVKDNKGNKYPVNLGTAWKAIYLTFLYYDTGITLKDFCDVGSKHHKIFTRIYDSLYNKKGTVKTFSYDPATANEDKKYTEKVEAAVEALRQYLSNIRKAFAEALPDERSARLFVISDRKEERYFTIQASNEEIRDKIKKVFHL